VARRKRSSNGSAAVRGNPILVIGGRVDGVTTGGGRVNGLVNGGSPASFARAGEVASRHRQTVARNMRTHSSGFELGERTRE
jgi:hypothetical protein